MATENSTYDNDRPAKPAPQPAKIGSKKFRLSRLALKELRETLRDRRTLVTLILMPLLVYPILSLVFKTFLLSNAGLLATDEPLVLQIVFGGDGDQAKVEEAWRGLLEGMTTIEKTEDLRESDSNDPATSSEEATQPTFTNNRLFANVQNHQWLFVSPDDPVSVEDFVDAGKADIGLYFEISDRKPWQFGKVTLYSRTEGVSTAAANYLVSNIEKLNDWDLRKRLSRLNLPSENALLLTEKTVGPEAAGGRKPVPLASLVPLILVLMTITGAVYPAIDLTAGERERGTLETLMAAPVPRMGILFSKFIAVLTVAVLTAVLNLIGMFATVWAFQLDKQLGAGVLTFPVMLQIFLLLILFAAFFSALLLAVTSFAKSFKEAQVYLIPIILLSLGPGLMAMAPGMSLDGINAVTPMVNILLLARDVIQNQVMVIPALVAVGTTMVYTYLAIRLAAYIFGSDSILYSAGGSFAEMFTRPRQPSVVVPLMATIFCLVMLFPINFASIGYLGRMPSDTDAQLAVRFLTMGLFTFLAFTALPWLVAKHQNTIIQSGFGLNRPSVLLLAAGFFLGVSLWPLTMYLTEAWHDIYGLIFGSEKQAEWAERLVETTADQVARIRRLSPWVILLSLSIIPAVCEEWFFRGMLLRSLLKSKKPWKAILISSIVFGAFHMLSNSVIAVDRLIPTTLIGLILGYIAYKSNSIIPGIVLHSLNNAIVVFLAYFQPTLTESYAWFPGEEDPIPMVWVGIGSGVAAVGLTIAFFARRAESIPASAETNSSASSLNESVETAKV